jgi:hypothetical protein
VFPEIVEPIQQAFRSTPTANVDLLLVVANTDGMAAPQQRLAAAFGDLVDELSSRIGPDLDLHVGVISTDLGAGPYDVPTCVSGGDFAKLQSAPREPGCQPPDDPYLSYSAGRSNVPGEEAELEKVTSAFSCIARLGTSGCRFVQPLEAARRALEPGHNPGFLRDDSMLAIVILTRQDDCSAANTALYDPSPAATETLGPLSTFRCFQIGVSCDVDDPSQPGLREQCEPSMGSSWLETVYDYYVYFHGLRPPGQVLLLVLGGPEAPVEVEVALEQERMMLQPSCETGSTSATPAIRLSSLAARGGTQWQLASICDPDYAELFTELALDISMTNGPPYCVGPLRDVERGTPGLQASCLVAELEKGQEVYGAYEGEIPQCTAIQGPCDPCPCWRVLREPSCNDFGGYELQIIRESATAPPGSLSTRPASANEASAVCSASRLGFSHLPYVVFTFVTFPRRTT